MTIDACVWRLSESPCVSSHTHPLSKPRLLLPPPGYPPMARKQPDDKHWQHCSCGCFLCLFINSKRRISSRTRETSTNRCETSTNRRNRFTHAIFDNRPNISCTPAMLDRAHLTYATCQRQWQRLQVKHQRRNNTQMRPCCRCLHSIARCSAVKGQRCFWLRGPLRLELRPSDVLRAVVCFYHCSRARPLDQWRQPVVSADAVQHWPPTAG